MHLCTTIHYLMNAKAPSKGVALGQLYRWKASREVPDTINGLLEYPEGFAVNLSSSFNNQSSAESSFQFLGTEGTLALDFTSMNLYPATGNEDNKWIVDSWPRALEDAYYRDPKVREAELTGTRKPRVLPGGEQYRAEGADATVSHFANWLASIRTRKGFWEDAWVGHRAAACAHLLNRSAKEERVIRYDPRKEDLS